VNEVRRVLCVAREADGQAAALVQHAGALAGALQAGLTLLDVLPTPASRRRLPLFRRRHT